MSFRSVLFDWDSTLSAIEGIDELARELPEERRRAVEQATSRAMAGELPLDAVYGMRLDAVAPSRARLRRLGERYFETLVPDAAELIAALRSLGKQVGVVSGGLRDAILVASRRLDIPDEWVHAVELRFDAHGEYHGFDPDAPLTRSGGKPVVLARVAAEHRPLAFVGDGITDLEVQPQVDLFVGFGGVVRRPEVERAAARYRTEPRLAFLLAELLSDEERAALRRSPRFAPLVAIADPD